MRFVKPRLVLFGLVAALFTAGCGGGVSQFLGQASGVITDANGDPVRGARVFAAQRETTTNSAGVYVLEGLPEGTWLIRAEITRNSQNFNGQNLARVFRNERTKSTNISVFRQDQQARIFGTVRDRFNNRVEGARVFADGGGLSAQVAITDVNGNYELRGLGAGVFYALSASARRFNSDTDSVTLTAGQEREFNFVLSDESNTTLPAPANLEAVAWTTPSQITRDVNQRNAIRAVQNMLDPRRAQRQGASSRTTPAGNWIEVDLYWDPLPGQFYSAQLGFGIYRATSQVGASTAIDFLRDPNATFYADLSSELRENRVYYYEVTAMNTTYPDSNNAESDFSNRFGVLTLGDLRLRSVTLNNPVRFNWDAAVAAEEYIVYVFDEFPGIGTTSIWNNAGSPTASTSLNYGGGSLQSGRRYYYIVMGVADNNQSRTLSPIGDFIAP